ncbi:GNAT family N-acetyltransferase [Burkholderia glumae]|uniref:GNAT family N-acetyltransferase n=1 Tax=Burkholderia glumae TaxID=337 RepID=UPI0003A8627D|nr:GNAT family N-acetyltransferase [Burkholderia glumae]MCM2492161.1 GNAT family N-acetyltransferase [Burkholderia glumae]MCM2543158.1 GNAT family N-acetyltransferase [Burkholderia glumae]PJO24816.1 N-acetyltransferase [Burkholderia glumae AU6208]QHE09962.1 GNAT family N-acetyltransferase [Burkholderia glumae AU6208]
MAAPLAGWTFRAARPEDAAACAPLILASGVREFGFFLGVPVEAMVAFLASAFASRHGRFSWRRHRVAVAPDGSVAGVLAAHDGRMIAFDDPHVAWLLLRRFGLRHTVASLLRGLVLEGELPAPKRSQTHVAHCAIDERWRGTGVFTALFEDTRRAGALGDGEGREVVLDVLLSNPRAAALYRRLGFVEQPRAKPVSPKLPPELESIRMRLGR